MLARLDTLESGLAFAAIDVAAFATAPPPDLRPMVATSVEAPPSKAPAVLGLVPTFPLPLGATRNLLSFSRSTLRSSMPSNSVPSPKIRAFFGRRMILIVGGGCGGLVFDEDVGFKDRAAWREDDEKIGEGLRAKGEGDGEDAEGARLAVDMEVDGKMLDIAPRIRAKEREVALAGIIGLLNEKPTLASESIVTVLLHIPLLFSIGTRRQLVIRWP